MKLEYLFPDVILKEDIGKESLSDIKKEIEYKFKEINTYLSSELEDNWGDRVITSAKKCKCIISTLKFNLLKSVIDPLIQTYINTLEIKYTKVWLESSWVNIVPQYGFQDLHIHNFNFITGCIYLDVPRNSGDIEFQPAITEIYLKPSIKYKPVAGNVFIFHGLLPHRVLCNNSNQNRISLSFNYQYDMVY